MKKVYCDNCKWWVEFGEVDTETNKYTDIDFGCGYNNESITAEMSYENNYRECAYCPHYKRKWWKFWVKK